ncbi:exostosin-2-like [Procambarus clarkii]|uniref:exostosin-2-like n=1 Tax=Procambarus clarkii TaxID=6728 RepID=UPI0037422761
MNSFDNLFYRKYRNFFISVLIVLVFAIILLACIQLLTTGLSPGSQDARLRIEATNHWEELVMGEEGAPTSTDTRDDCHYFNCFNMYRCGRSGTQRISVYVYPMTRYVDEDHIAIKPMSREFFEIIDTILNSEYYTPNPHDACILVPPVDTLNENNLRKDKIAQTLAMLPYWSEGENHLLFTMLPGTPPIFDTTLNLARGKALMAGGGFSSFTYRRGYDVSLPVYNPAHQDSPVGRKPVASRRWFVVSSQINLHRDYREDLEGQHKNKQMQHNDLLILDKCQPFTNLTVRCHGSKIFSYPEVLRVRA